MVCAFYSVILSLFVFSCQIEATPTNNQSEDEVVPLNPEITENTALIQNYFVNGGNAKCTLVWRTVDSSKYDTFIIDENGEEINVNDKTEYIIENLTNSVYDQSQSKWDMRIYSFSLVVRNKNGEELEKQTASATVMNSALFSVEYKTDTGSDMQLIPKIVKPNAQRAQLATTEQMELDFNSDDITVGKIILYVEGVNDKNGNPRELNKPDIFNNPECASKICSAILVRNNKDYIPEVHFKCEENEVIEWFTVTSGKFYYGQRVNKYISSSGYNDCTSKEFETALDFMNSTEAFRTGTIIKTKGYYEAGDGGKAKYVISNRSDYTYGTLSSKIGQKANIIYENLTINARALGAGHCTQVTTNGTNRTIKTKDFNEYKEACNSKNDFEKYKQTHLEWMRYSKNDDTERFHEALSALKEMRKYKNLTTDEVFEDTTKRITLYIPAGTYRLGSQFSIFGENILVYGDTKRGALDKEGKDILNETKTILYTDNGYTSKGEFLISAWSLSNSEIRGISHHAWETDSGKYQTDGKNEWYTPSWYLRELAITYCSNLLIEECEFIINDTVRAENIYGANGDEYEAYDEKGNPTTSISCWDGKSDLHITKQFTTVTFYAGNEKCTLNKCLLINRAGVIGGASLGIVNMFPNGDGNTRDIRVTNCALYHNCHDEMIGVWNYTFVDNFTLDAIFIENNLIVPENDEHVQKVRNKSMLATFGYNSKGQKNYYIRNNHFIIKEFGGGDAIDEMRVENFVFENNTIDIINYGKGTYFQNGIARNNTFNIMCDNGTNKCSGNIVRGDNDCNNDTSDVFYKNNTFNFYCDFTGTATREGGHYEGNTFNYRGSTGTIIDGPASVKNNTFNIDGFLSSCVIHTGSDELQSNKYIIGNSLNYSYDDHGYDFSEPLEAWKRFSFASVANTIKKGTKNYGVFIGGNTISAPNCSSINKNFIFYSASATEKVDCAPVYISKNKMQKFLWLRSKQGQSQGNFVYTFNYDEKGNLLDKDDLFITGLEFSK